MNSSPDPLSTLLQSWQPEAADTRDFNRGVWLRIESRASVATLGWAWIAEMIALFARPHIALVAAMIALFCGLFLGTLHARSAEEEHYLQSLNPYSPNSSQASTR